MPPREPGQLLSGKYRLIRLLGQGGMGSVWHAHHVALNAPVALKFIESEELDAASLQRFLGEARVAAALRSPHVVQILDYGVDEQTPHFAMELLEGETLAARLLRQGPLGVEFTLRVVQHVARAIARAHDAGVIHRDLKPANVFIVRNDDDELIKVLDFGIAKSTQGLLADSAAASTRTGTMLGTPLYMSPEQLDACRSIDFRADLWALGVVVYQCLLGKLPFAGESIGQVVLSICSRPLPVPSQHGAVPAGFDAWFSRACARDVDARFASARQAALEFTALCGGDATAWKPAAMVEGSGSESAAPAHPLLGFATTSRATSSEAPRPEPRRRPWRALAALALVLLAAVAVLLVRKPGNPVVPPAPEPVASAGDAPAAALEPAAHDGFDRAAEGPTSPQPTAKPAAVSENAAAAPPPVVPLPAAVRTPVKASALRPAERAPRDPSPGTIVKPATPKPAAEPERPNRIPEVPPADLDLGI